MPDPANDATPIPPSELVWQVCPYVHGRDLKDCKRCPPVEVSRYGACTRGCYMMAQEVVNIVQTGNPWRKTHPADDAAGEV